MAHLTWAIKITLLRLDKNGLFTFLIGFEPFELHKKHNEANGM